MKNTHSILALRPWLVRAVFAMALLSGGLATTARACEWVVDGYEWVYDPEYYWIEGHYDWISDGEGGYGYWGWVEGHFEGESFLNPYGHWEGEDCE